MKKNKRSFNRRPIVMRLLSSVALIPHVLTITLQMERPAMAGSCTVGAVSVCSGAASGADVMPFFDESGPLTITTDPGFGLSITNGDYGMSISADGGLSFTDDYASTIETNGDYGIYIENDISGNLNLVSTGSVISTGAGGDGIRAYNYGEDTDIQVHDAQGENNGINIIHHGTGAIKIVATGAVTGFGTGGIFAEGGSGTSLTVEAVDTEGPVQGIFARNNTTGALDITSTGLARGTDGDGIRADNYGTDIHVTAADTHGQDIGIIAQNWGAGSLQIDSTGSATGDDADGIYVYSVASSTDATINAVDATGGSSGIFVLNLGSGSTTINATGTIIGSDSNGASIRTGSDGTTVDATFNNVQGGDNGIKIDHQSLVGASSNAAAISVTGHILGGTGYGIRTETLAGVLTTIDVEAGALVESTAGNGIANGDGDSDVTVADGATVNGRIDLGLGSDTLSLRGGLSGTTVLDGGGGGIDKLNVYGAVDETRATSDIANWSVVNLDDSDLTLTGGTMTVGTAGDMTTGIFLTGGSVLDGSNDNFSLFGNLSLAAGTRFLASGNGSGTSSVSGNLVNAGTISAVGGGAGDTVTIAGDYSGDDGIIELETTLGDDTSATDRLDIQGDTSGTSTLRVTNVGGVGAATSEGIELIAVGGVSNGTFILDGDYEISGVSVVVAGAYSYRLFKGNRTGTETDNWYLRSELTDPTDPEDPTDPTDPEDPTDPTDPEDPTDPTDPEDPTDPTDPEDPTDPTDPEDPTDPTDPEDPTDPTDPEDPTDPTDPEHPTDPTDPEDPTDPTDPEDPTDPTDPEDPTDPTDPEDPTDPTDPEDPTDPTDPEDPTDPTDPEDPTDPTDPEDPTDPTDPEDPTDPTDPEDPTDPTDPEDPLYQPGVPVYEAYPQALLGLNTMSTLQQRVGNRFWLVGGIPEVHQQGASNDLSSAFLAVSGIWARIEGAYSDIEPRFATAGAAFDQSIFRAQAGVDSVFYESANGTLMAGLSTHYRHGVTDIDSIHGIGKISSDGYGAGGALTWYGNDGTYLDGQAQATWYETDLRSLTANRFLVRDNDAFGYALSLEGGKRVAIDDGWSITPQAQIVYSRVDFDRFKDVFGSSVSLDKGASLQGRLGLTLDREMTWQDARGLTSRVNAYGIANIYHEFLNGTRVDVAGEKFRVRQDRLWGGIGAGGTYSWNDGRYSLYAEGLLNTSLAHVGDSYSLQGKIGFRAKW